MRKETCVFDLEKIDMTKFNKINEFNIENNSSSSNNSDKTTQNLSAFTFNPIYYYDKNCKKIVEITSESLKIFNKKGTRILKDIPIVLQDKVKALSLHQSLNFILLLFTSVTPDSKDTISLAKMDINKVYLLDLNYGEFLGDFKIQENLEYLLDFFFIGESNDICLISCDSVLYYSFDITEYQTTNKNDVNYSIKMRKISSINIRTNLVIIDYSYCQSRKFLCLLQSNNEVLFCNLNDEQSYNVVYVLRLACLTQENKSTSIFSFIKGRDKLATNAIKKSFDSIDYYTKEQILLEKMYQKLCLFFLSLKQSKVFVYSIESWRDIKEIAVFSLAKHGNFVGIQAVDNLLLIHAFFAQSFIVIDLFSLLYDGKMEYKLDEEIEESLILNKKVIKEIKEIKGRESNVAFDNNKDSANNIHNNITCNSNGFEPIINISELNDCYKEKAFYITGEFLANRNIGMKGGTIYILKFNPKKYRELVRINNEKILNNVELNYDGIIFKKNSRKIVSDSELLINLLHRKNCKLITASIFSEAILNLILPRHKTSTIKTQDNTSSFLNLKSFIEHLSNLESIAAKEKAHFIDLNTQNNIRSNQLKFKAKFQYLCKHYIEQNDVFLTLTENIRKLTVDGNKTAVFSDKNKVFSFFFFVFFYLFAHLSSGRGCKISPTFFHSLSVLLELSFDKSLLLPFLNNCDYWGSVKVAKILLGRVDKEVGEDGSIIEQLAIYLLMKFYSDKNDSFGYLFDYLLKTKNISFIIYFINNNRFFNKEQTTIKKLLVDKITESEWIKNELIDVLL